MATSSVEDTVLLRVDVGDRLGCIEVLIENAVLVVQHFQFLVSNSRWLSRVIIKSILAILANDLDRKAVLQEHLEWMPDLREVSTSVFPIEIERTMIISDSKQNSLRKTHDKASACLAPIGRNPNIDKSLTGRISSTRYRLT